MRINTRPALLAALALTLSLMTPLPAYSQEGRPEAGRDPRRGVESDEQRRRDDERRRDDLRATAIETTGRRTDLAKRQNAEFSSASTLAAEARSETRLSQKIEKQIPERGWSEKEVRDLLKTEPTGKSADNTYGRSDPASVFGKSGGYVVMNDVTKEVVQVSDKNDPTWKDDRRIHWK